jgi:hypothetical protein
MQAILGMTLAAAVMAAPVAGSASAIAADDQLLSTVSELKGLKFTLLNKLPAAPAKSGDTQACAASIVQPTTKAGRLVAARGWSVTGEAKVGGFQAVSFAGRFEDGTSGTCSITDGNVAVYDNDVLVAIAYAERSSKLSIGRIAGLEGGALRLWSGDFLPAPIGDIELTGDNTLRLGAVAGAETLCAGKAVVPNIYGMSIDKARAALAAKGWSPVPAEPNGESDASSREADLIKQGIPEVDGCAGTGLAYCSFNYRGAAGTLAVSTAGEDDLPQVVGYEATCQ